MGPTGPPDGGRSKEKGSSQHKGRDKKIARIPKNARVEKRPLYRPAIASPHSGSCSPKIIYVSSKTPFMSAVKRAEKLLRGAERRLVQSATTLANRQKNSSRHRNTDSNIDMIAEIVERQRSRNNKTGIEAREEIVLKGTGKAIGKVMEMGHWFLQRPEYSVRIRTATLSAIDDVVRVPRENPELSGDSEDDSPHNKHDANETPLSNRPLNTGKKASTDVAGHPAGEVELESYTRLRNTSALEVYVALR